MVNCIISNSIKTCSESDWRARHNGHKIEEVRDRVDKKRTIRGLYCHDCATRWATLEVKGEKIDGAGAESP